MEMEHINENTIRVVIENEDLIDRGITFLDLLGNHKEIENFFYSILEEVDVEEEFRGSEAVTFQVLPKGDGLELFISKNLPLDELEELEETGSSPEEVSDFLRKRLMSEEETEEAEKLETTENPGASWADEYKTIVVELDNFEQMIQFAQEVCLEHAKTSLYLFHERYYLEIEFRTEDMSERTTEDQLARILEFAKSTGVTAETLTEYGELLMEHDAVELTNYYFNK